MWRKYGIYCQRLSRKKENLLNINNKNIKTNFSLFANGEIPPTNAEVIICGGGVMGAAVAYHLAIAGWGNQTVLIESSRFGGGTTWHASGLIGAFKPSLTQVKLAQDSIALFKELEKKGLPTGWKQCGSLSIARTGDRMTVFRRMKAQSVTLNVECYLVTPEEIKKICPMLKVDDLYGGLWIPGDGVGDPYQICLTLLGEAIKNGVRAYENCKLIKVKTTDDKIRAVETSHGTIECKYFVNCTGFWARSVGKLSEPYVKVPLHPVEHYYLHTKPIPNLDPMTPVIRDLDGYVYFRENAGRILAGGFEPVAKPVFENGLIPVGRAMIIKPITAPDEGMARLRAIFSMKLL